MNLDPHFLIKRRFQLVKVGVEAIASDGRKSCIASFFKNENIIKNFDDMLIEIPITSTFDTKLFSSRYGGVFNVHSDVGTFSIHNDGRMLIIQDEAFSLTDKTITKHINDIDGLLYDLKDSDYEGNICEINQMEREIALLEQIIDFKVIYPSLKP